MKNTNIKTTHNYNNTKKIINWSEYNNSLKKRGNLSVFISESIIKNGRIVFPKKTGKVGRPKRYSDEFIEFVLSVRELFRLPFRQTVGLIEYLFGLMGLSVDDLPDYSTLSRRMSTLNVRYYSNSIHDKSGIVMLIDSSGFKVFGEGEWMVRKHGATYRRTWRETHIALDYKTKDIIGFINTSAHVHDNTQLEPLLSQVMNQNGYKVNTVIGDGAYDANDNYKLGKRLGIEFLAPLRKDAVEHLNSFHYQTYDTPGWEERNAVVRHVEEFGLDGWKADVDYHRRSLVENAFFRWKTIFGGNLKSRKIDTQFTEQCLRAKIINKFNKIGLPKYELAK